LLLVINNKKLVYDKVCDFVVARYSKNYRFSIIEEDI